MAKIQRKYRQSEREETPLHVGYQWGESLDGGARLDVKRVRNELTITAAFPHYGSENHPCDLVQRYKDARKEASIGKQHTGKDSPHIRFANADCDEDLIDFVRDFGPVVCSTSNLLASMTPKRSLKATKEEPVGALLEARQDFRELRNEQKIYRACSA